MTGIDAELVEIAGGMYDIQIGEDGDIKTIDAFDAAIIVSIFGERRANESEVVDSTLRRGWIGNESTPGIEIGSKIWLYEQSRLTRTVFNGVAGAGHESLVWFVDDGLAVAILSVTPYLTLEGLNIEIVIQRPNSIVEKRHFKLWDNTGLTAGLGD